MSTTTKRVFPPDAGEFIDLSHADKLINAFHEKETKKGKKILPRLTSLVKTRSRNC